MKKINSGYSSDSEQNNKQDLSILRKPISTGCSGFLEAKRAYDNGTEEIRRLLSRECDILYECKFCRNIFRSLTNFISHKRVYCRAAFNNLSNHFNINNGYMDQDVSTIIQEEKDFINHSSTTKDNRNNENSNKDLSSIIERLLKREQANRLMKLTDFYDQVNNKLTQDELLKKKHELLLDRVPNSNVAVYQTVKKIDSDNIKKEVNEINDIALKRKTFIGSDGKAVVKDSLSETDFSTESFVVKLEGQKQAAVADSMTCDICNLKFSTEKTLKLHLQTKHISSTFVYQCPSCAQTFLQPRAVFRHLSNDHKKSSRRIRMMRDSILKRRIRMDEIQSKGPSRELARLQTDNEKREAETKIWIKKANLANESPMCVHCGKTFERKAVLTTHLNNCPMKSKYPGPQTRRYTEMASGSSSRNQNILPKSPSILNRNDLNELRHIKELDLNNLNDYMDLNGTVSRDTSPVNKRKRKRTSKVLQESEPPMDTSKSLNDLFWSINSTTENMALKTVSFHKSPSSTPPPDIKSESQKKPQVAVEKSEKNVDSSSALKSHKEVSFYCRICEKKFDVLSNLRRHISMFHYRKRKFGCKLCDYRAFRKYDVINHLNSNHSITGEREEVLHYVVVKESKGERNEENIDADVIIDENGTFEQDVLPKIVEKRRRRTKAMKEASKSPTESPPRDAGSGVEIKNEPKFTRTPSNLSLSSNDEGSASSLSKRPIRNRVKPVNKDFVYDLSNLLKKDMVVSEKTQRRRNTQTIVEDIVPDVSTPIDMTNGETKTDPLTPPRSTSIDSNIKGAAMVMARSAVDLFTATFYKPPELPLERPSIINRLVTSAGTSEPILSDCSRLKSQEIRRLSDDSLPLFMVKRRKQDSNLSPKRVDSLSEIFSPEIELNINGDTKVKLSSDRTLDDANDSKKIVVKLFSSEKEFKERLVANRLTEPGIIASTPAFPDPTKLPSSSIASSTSSNGIGATSLQLPQSVSSSNLPTNMKRITMLERLAENKLRGNFLKLT